ncbi:hypothetical protein Ancab_011757, partial [Ancistrocladus abbreviatus]
FHHEWGPPPKNNWVPQVKSNNSQYDNRRINLLMITIAQEDISPKDMAAFHRQQNQTITIV